MPKMRLPSSLMQPTCAPDWLFFEVNEEFEVGYASTVCRTMVDVDSFAASFPNDMTITLNKPLLSCPNSNDRWIEVRAVAQLNGIVVLISDTKLMEGEENWRWMLLCNQAEEEDWASECHIDMDIGIDDQHACEVLKMITFDYRKYHNEDIDTKVPLSQHGIGMDGFRQMLLGKNECDQRIADTLYYFSRL
eukprot:gnl/MRDRNA2_/MRDRNA2_23854_c0_seq1.p1 gnl/MRDRNA2_/MRDRNA2_23854_c0~~gnl/MRDRNA2_/MRDRNA2_23854_c0_seq1.p1  ORF type:complete len:191 (-),score=35.66 gnl/MRDRNA2_/MRDRNA2_23854_c0_seq1:194-766(-)